MSNRRPTGLSAATPARLLLAGMLSMLLDQGPVAAQAPHEILLLANSRSPESLQIANEYAALRSIPPENVVLLPLPDSVLEPEAQITPEDFTRWIWEPAQDAVRRRGLEGRISAWAYSAGFPVRITADPPVSLTGLTFVRNSLPAADRIAQGTYPSPFFAGPDQADGPVADTHSLPWFRRLLGDKTPLPAMMLGYTGARGNDVQAVLSCLRRGAMADGTRPTGTVYFVTMDDVRSRCREWQFSAAADELASLEVGVRIVTGLVPTKRSILGYMVGTSSVMPFYGAEAFAPGAMAEHLTSAAAIFHDPDQVKLSAWIAGGATATAGTVTEPRAIWTKFPAARFYAHLARGCTILDSFCQSIRSPLQLLLVGEPLAAPFAPVASLALSVTNMPEGWGFRASLEGAGTNAVQYFYMLDGRAFLGWTSRAAVGVFAEDLSDGWHEFRAVAAWGEPVVHMASATASLICTNRGHAVEWQGLTAGAEYDLHHPVALTLQASDQPHTVGIAAHGEPLLRGSGAVSRVVLDPSALGAGPHRLTPYAAYEDGMLVRGAPVDIRIAEINDAPSIQGIARTTNDSGVITLSPSALDREGDPVTLTWFEPADLDVGAGRKLSGGVVTATNGWWRFEPGGETVTCLFGSGRDAPQEISVEFSVNPGGWAYIDNHRLGLVFNAGKGRVAFFGLWGRPGALEFAEGAPGKLERRVARGVVVYPERSYTLRVRRSPEGLQGWIGDRLVCTWAGRDFEAGSWGVLAGGEGGYFRDLQASPPWSAPRAGSEEGSILSMDPKGFAGRRLVVRADDGWRGTEQAVDF